MRAQAMSRRRDLLVALLLLVVLSAAARPLPAAAQAEHHAGLVVDFRDGRVIVRVVAFTGDSITGVELLQRSGLSVALLAGAAVCAVEDVGCAPTPQDCFCQCRGGECLYWSYFHLEGGAWVYAPTGAASHILRDGDVDGWVWGSGQTAPPLLTWEQIWALAGPAAPVQVPPSAEPGRPPTGMPATPSASPTVPTAPVDTAAPPPTEEVSPRPVAWASPAALATEAVPAVRPSAAPLPTATETPPIVTALGGAHPPGQGASTGGAADGGLYTALGFGGLVLLLLGLWLGVRWRRRAGDG